MQEALDPYTPGAGRSPRELIGRDADLEALDVLVVRAARGLGPARPLLLTGLRGVGKTVLLNRMMSRAAGEGWVVIKIEAAQGRSGAERARRAIAGGLLKAALAYRERGALSEVGRMLATVTSFSVSFGLSAVSLGVERDPIRASTGSLELDLQDVVADVVPVLGQEHAALAVFVDEMQDLDDDLMGALLAIQHEASQQGWQVYVIGAGLPSMPGRLAAARSYAERMFQVRQIGRLCETDARRVLTEPAEHMGASYHDDALNHLVEASGRYPYFLQEFGSATWRVARSSPFTLRDAEAAEKLGLTQLDSMFFLARWERATPAEREYLIAMAADHGGPSASAAVATRLGKSPSSLGPARANLISKGLVYAPERGSIAFTVPGFSQFVQRRVVLEGRG